MWELIEIGGSNVLSFKKVHYTLKQGLTTLVYGFNNDSENGNSNGSGKSSILEIISVATVGKPLRKCKADEVINDEAESAIFSVTYKNKVLGENMRIVRQIFRKASSIVDVYIYKDGDEPDSGDCKLSGVDDYNKFIMDKLGVTREEFLNNFVLSKYQYENFLSVSDKEKKEIINRFSNGILIDQSIEKLLEDMEPERVKLEDAKVQVVSVEGKILAVKEQIEDEISTIEEKKELLATKIADHKKDVADLRASIRKDGEEELLHKTNAEVSSDLLGSLYALDEATRENEAEDVVAKLENFCKKHELKIGNFQNGLKSINDTFKNISSRLSEKQKEHDNESEKINEIQASFDSIVKKCSDATESSDKKKLERTVQLEFINADLKQANNDIASCQDAIYTNDSQISRLKTILNGAVECPKCHYHFDLKTDEGADVIETKIKSFEKLVVEGKDTLLKRKEEAIGIKAKKDLVLDEIDTIEDETSAITSELSRVRSELNLSSVRVNALSREMKELDTKSNECEKVVDDFINSCIDAIEAEITLAIKAEEDACETIVKAKSRKTMQVESILGSIESLEASKPEDGISVLKERLGKYENDLDKADRVKAKCQKEFDKYSAQEVLFNEYKTYLANTKINALSEVTNSFLEEIGSELRVKFNGYTMLKSGKVRDKISISLLRDGMEVGSFGKLSVGEAARINLACILAMNKLINVNCDQNKGINLLVLDEICDGVDNQGLMSMLEALNRIGITSIFISHGQIAENYEHYIKIIKENGESRIDD